MTNITTVNLTAGVPTGPAGASTVSTIDALMADGGQATLGAKADATWDGSAAASGISIWRYLGVKLEAIRALLVSGITVSSHAVTNAGTFAVQSTLTAGALILGKVGIDQTTDGTTNLVRLGAETTKVIGTVNVAASQLSPLGQTTMSASAPVVIASDQSQIKTNPGVSATANGATKSRINATASNNLTSVKASAGQLYTIDVFNVAAYNVFLKLYDKASAPVVASDTPVMTIPIQAGGGYSKTWPMGLPFATGIAYAIVKLQADTDATNVVAGDLTGNIVWI